MGNGDVRCGSIGPSPQDPWRRAVGGLQRNCRVFALSVAQVQQTVGGQLTRLQDCARPVAAMPVASLSHAAAAWTGGQGGGQQAGGGVSREDVGRATWTFLHTLAAQYPERPTRQQRRDAHDLVRWEVV